MKIFIPLLFVLFTCYACTSQDKTTEIAKDSLSLSVLDSSTTLFVANDKPLSDSFVVIGDSVLFPGFEIEVSLTDAAEKLLKEKKESIIVIAYISGIPKDTTLEEYKDWGKVHLKNYSIELMDSRIARFDHIIISKEVLNELVDTNVEILINVYTGRRSSSVNLITCDLLQEGIETIKGKRYVLKGSLL
jgi:hypothetical protein